MLDEITLLSFFVFGTSCHYIEMRVQPAPGRTILMCVPGMLGLSVGNLEIEDHLPSSGCRGLIGCQMTPDTAGWLALQLDSCTSRNVSWQTSKAT